VEVTVQRHRSQSRQSSSWRDDPANRIVLTVLVVANLAAASVLALLYLGREDPGDSPAPASASGGGGQVDSVPVDPLQGQGEGNATAAAEAPLLTPPEEFLPVGDENARTGELSLDDVVRLDGSRPEVARERFAELGFEGARSRAWQSAANSLLVVAYRFADEQGAETFVDDASALRRADPAATPLSLPGIPGGSAFQLQVPGDPTQVAFLARGGTAYVVGLVGPAAGDRTAAELHRLAALQYDAAL
jgi:hypothetical protein